MTKLMMLELTADLLALMNFSAEAVKDSKTFLQPERFLILAQVAAQFAGNNPNVLQLFTQCFYGSCCNLHQITI